MFHVKHQYVALNVSYETLQTADKAPETRLNNQPNYASSFSKGEVATRNVDGRVIKML